jgi:hypothetical protein
MGGDIRWLGGRDLRNLSLFVVLLLVSGCAHEALNNDAASPLPAYEVPPWALGVSFLCVTNNGASNEMRGVFQITNRLDKYVYILHWSVTTSNQSGWSVLRREWYSPGMINPHEQFLLNTWAPPRGGPYRLELRRRAEGSGSQFFSPPFTVSAGPPMQQEDFPAPPVYYTNPGQ